MNTGGITYTDLFLHAKNHHCDVVFHPPDVYVLQKNPKAHFAVITSNDVFNEQPSEDCLRGICTQLGIPLP
jgi:hypothetical protein